MPRRDYSGFYEELGVSPDASPQAIKAAYRKRVKAVHPDVPGGSEAGFQTLKEAYEVLKDNERRLQYDVASQAMDAQADREQLEAAEPPTMDRQVLEAAAREVERARRERRDPHQSPELENDAEALSRAALSLEDDKQGLEHPPSVLLRAAFVAAGIVCLLVFLPMLVAGRPGTAPPSPPIAQPIRQESRSEHLAIVIGNGRYRSAVHLPHALPDADLVGRELGELGYDVFELSDGSLKEMEATLAYALGRASPTATVVLYYAGHGLQVDARNYLVPVDARLTDPNSLPQELVDVDYLVSLMASEKRTVVALLDTCRDRAIVDDLLATYPDALAGRVLFGPASTTVTSGNVFYGYSAAAGKSATDGRADEQNGPFATSLAKYLKDSSLSVSDLMTRVSADVYLSTDGQQQPWQQSSLKATVSIAGVVPRN